MESPHSTTHLLLTVVASACTPGLLPFRVPPAPLPHHLHHLHHLHHVVPCYCWLEERSSCSEERQDRRTSLRTRRSQLRMWCPSLLISPHRRLLIRTCPSTTQRQAGEPSPSRPVPSWASDSRSPSLPSGGAGEYRRPSTPSPDSNWDSRNRPGGLNNPIN